MAKTKGSTAAGKENRVQRVITLIVKFGGSDDQIKDILKKSEPNLSSKTIQRAIAEAWERIQNIGNQPAEKERGLLWQRSEDLYITESRKENPNPQLLKQHLGSSISIYKTNPNLKTNGRLTYDEPKSTPGDALSSELENALAKFGVFKPNTGSTDSSTSP